MCYSAKLTQSLKEYFRLTGAVSDLNQIESVFRARLLDDKLRIPRGFERNFDEPKSEQEERIHGLIVQYRELAASKLEQELFQLRQRLANAKRKLQVKETKTALNEERVATNKIESIRERLSLMLGTQPHLNDDRIFPMWFAPLVLEVDGQRVLRLARYHLRQTGKPSSIDKERPGLYNLRRDSIPKYWRREFGHSHALMLANSFFENVERESGNVRLHFVPRPAQLMWIACLYAVWTDPTDGTELLSFGAITDEPPEEVSAAGHDRMIINIQPENAANWLHPEGQSTEQLQAIFSDRQKPYYEHKVEAAA